jgi:hypothetical protein
MVVNQATARASHVTEQLVDDAVSARQLPPTRGVVNRSVHEAASLPVTVAKRSDDACAHYKRGTIHGAAACIVGRTQSTAREAWWAEPWPAASPVVRLRSCGNACKASLCSRARCSEDLRPSDDVRSLPNVRTDRTWTAWGTSPAHDYAQRCESHPSSIDARPPLGTAGCRSGSGTPSSLSTLRSPGSGHSSPRSLASLSATCRRGPPRCRLSWHTRHNNQRRFSGRSPPPWLLKTA